MFRRSYVKPESQATTNHKCHKLTFVPNRKSLPDFLAELNESAERAFGDNAPHMIDSSIFTTIPLHLKRSLILAYFEIGTNDQIVKHLEKQLELTGLENDGELTKPTLTAIFPNDNQQNTEQTKNVSFNCKSLGQVIRDCRKRMKKEQEQKNDPLIPNTKTLTSKSFAPCSYCQRTNHPPQKCWSGPNAPHRPKRFKQDHPADNKINGQGNLNNPALLSILKDPLN